MRHARTEMPNREYDVVVIGAGVNGISAARELAGQGYRILLVDKDDLASGASGRSSRMLHCGLRYFEAPAPLQTFAIHPLRFAGALRMAREAMQARREIAGRVPHRVKPFTMCFPVYDDGVVRAWHLDLGFRLLGALGPAEPPLDYRRLTRDFGAHLPFAGHLRDVDRLRAIATYREYVFDWPERLCVDLALEAERLGAEVRTFCHARIGRRDPEGRWSVELTDRDGTGGTTTVQAGLVLNMAGTWIDEVNAAAAAEARRRPLVRGTKGAHMLVRLPDAYRGFGIATMNRAGMPFYCLPSHGDHFYFGPTETPFEGDASNVGASAADIDFLLAEARFMLPGLELSRRDVVLTWAGVRPLTHDPQRPMGRRTREIHDLSDRGLPGVFAMTAGPLMTHPSAGRKLAELVARRLQPSGRRTEPAPAPAETGVPGIAGGELGGDALNSATVTAVRDEHARDLKGILYRRTGLAWRRHLDRGEVEHAAGIAAPLLGWSGERTRREIADFLDYQKTVFRTVPDPDRGTGSQFKPKSTLEEQVQ